MKEELGVAMLVSFEKYGSWLRAPNTPPYLRNKEKYGGKRAPGPNRGRFCEKPKFFVSAQPHLSR